MNNRNRRFSLLLVSVLGTVSVLSQPVLAGSGKKALNPDKRTLLTIPYQDREDLLHVMRNNLTNIGRLIDAMSENDFEAVETIANEMSFNKKKGKGLARRGNPAFTAMGVQFHGLDTLAVKKAAEARDRKGTLRAMSRMVSTCVGCHATFRVMEWPDNKAYTRPKPTPLILPPGVVIRSK
ncbi:MAG: hypothetical protein Q9M27_04350 [Mariprofundaceae bacterium]|nr:hypothetical protein [Mariprofundaceae bacterium]